MQSHTHFPHAIVLLGAIVALGCSDDPPPGPGPGPNPTPTTSVNVADNTFQPAANTVTAGQTVTWTWSGNNPHNVTFDDAAVGNSATQTDGSFLKTFTAAGDFSYFCTVHGRAIMSGRVTVTSTGG